MRSSQAFLPCLGAQAWTRVLLTIISARWMIRQSRRITLHSTEKGWPSTVWADLEEPNIIRIIDPCLSEDILFTFN